MTLDQVFGDMRKRLAARPELIESVGGVFQFDISGDDGGTWTVDLKNATGSVTQGADSEADCVITLNTADFLGIVAGTTDPMSAFLMGKVKVAGDLGLATKLSVLF